MLFARQYASPFGPLGLLVDDAGRLHRIAFLATSDDDLSMVFRRHAPVTENLPAVGKLALDEVQRQLDEYYQGHRWRFDLQLVPDGTPFQNQVWDTLLAIPAGETRTYRQVAESIGRPKAMRAVGRANATNPIPIVIPCHRLVGTNGSLTGFAGGLGMKHALLDHERSAGS